MRPDPMIGVLLDGHLEILSRLGHGGMSVVYKAKDVLLNRLVAVKVLSPQMGANPKVLLRFRQEAMAASRLNHPNIIRIHEFVVPDDGQAYLVMDYIEGQSLADLIASGPIELQRAVSITGEICDGLEQAHTAGVIHRDLKPANIMLLKKDSAGASVKLVDFGIAKLGACEGEDSHALTQTGELFGSPLYMSPEQCQAKVVDKRSDLYSLACVVYEMLTGQPPFKGSSLLETIQWQTERAPKSVREIHPFIKNADALDSVLFKAMEKDPCKRFQSAGEFKQAIQGAARREMALAEKAQFKWRTQKRQIRALADKRSLLVGVLGAAALLFYGSATIFRNAKDHTEPYSQTTNAPDRKSTINADLTPIDQWHQLNQHGQNSFDIGEFKTAESDFRQALALTQTQSLGKQYEQATLENLVDLARAAGSSDRESTARLQNLAAQNELATKKLIEALGSSKETPVNLIEQAITECHDLERQCRFDEALNIAEACTRAIRASRRPDELQIAKCELIRARALLSQGKTDRSTLLALRLHSVKVLRKSKEDAVLLAHSLSDLGWMYLTAGQPSVAQNYFVEAFNVYSQLNDRDHNYEKEMAFCLRNSAACYFQLGNKKMGRVTLDQSIFSLNDRVAESDRDGRYYYICALTSQTNGDQAAADRNFAAQLKQYEKIVPRDYLGLQDALSCVGVVSKKPTVKMALLKRCLAILDRLELALPDQRTDVLFRLSDACDRIGDQLQQRAVLTMMFKTIETYRIAEPKNCAWPDSLGILAVRYELVSPIDLKSAHLYAQKYLTVAEKRRGADSLQTGEAMSILAAIYADEDNPQEARPWLDKTTAFLRQYKARPGEQAIYAEIGKRVSTTSQKLAKDHS